MKTQILNFSDQVRTIACNGRFLAIGFASGTIKIQENQLGAYVLVRSWRGHQQRVLGLVFPSGGGLVSGSWDGFVKSWDLEMGRDEKRAPKEISAPKELWVRNFGGVIVYTLAELPGGRLAAGCDDGTVQVLDLSTGQESSQGGVCRGHTWLVSAVISLGVVGDLSADSFASGSWDRTIRVWVASLPQKGSLPALTLTGVSATEGGTTSPGTAGRVVEVGGRVLTLSLSPCGGLVAAGCGDGSVRLFRLPEWDDVWKDGSAKVHTDWVRSLSFSPDGRFIASASDDHLVNILSAETGAILKTLEGHANVVWSVLFSQDGFSVLSGSWDNTVRIWRLVDKDDRIASLLSGRSPSDLVYQGGDVFKRLFFKIRTKLI